MTASALYTFTVCLPFACSVELLGSWDNFTKLYNLEKDRQRGQGYWTGCHTFENIICDGDPSQHVKSRSGNLKQGGLYWYHYVIDGNIDYCDFSEKFTSTCPLLPGQMVNILDMPVELPSTTAAERVQDLSDVYTLNPRDRYKELKPPTKSRLLSPFGLFGSRDKTPVGNGARRLSRMFTALQNISSETITQARGKEPTQVADRASKITSLPQSSKPASSPMTMVMSPLGMQPTTRGFARPVTRYEHIPAFSDRLRHRADEVESAGSSGLSPPNGAFLLPYQTRLLGHHMDYETDEPPIIHEAPSGQTDPWRNREAPKATPLLPGQSTFARTNLFVHNPASPDTSIAQNRESNSFEIETPPQLCSTTSTNASPGSFFLSTPSHHRHGIQNLPQMRYCDVTHGCDDIVEFLEPCRPLPAKLPQSYRDHNLDQEQPRLGSPFQLQMREPLTDLDNPFSTTATTRNDTQQHSQAYGYAPRDAILQDLAYLGSAIS